MQVPPAIEQDGMDRLGGPCDHFLARRAGKAVGALRCLRLDGGMMQVQRLCVAADCRGQGVGRAVLRLVERHYRTAGARGITLDAKHQATGFYEKCGYRQVSAPFMEAGIPHVRMEKGLG